MQSFMLFIATIGTLFAVLAAVSIQALRTVVMYSMHLSKAPFLRNTTVELTDGLRDAVSSVPRCVFRGIIAARPRPLIGVV